MILVTGGAGFIGSATVQALNDLGETCVLAQRREAAPHDDRNVVERVDITDRDALLDIGARHKITGIVHLAFSMPWPPGVDEPVAGARKALQGLLNIVEAAQEWDVTRLGVASTIGVYMGTSGVRGWREDAPLPLTSGHVIPAFKKVGELLNAYLAGTTGLEIVNYRIAGTWGPGRRPGPFAAAGHLVLAAAEGRAPDLDSLAVAPRAGDASDLCYAKDAGRALALLHLADRLDHRTYNVGSGRPTSNAEVIAAIRKVVPGARVDLPEGQNGPPLFLDIARLREATGFRPAYDVERATADYLECLRSPIAARRP
jgi:UDP-glucose 4-epimerase